MNYSIGFKDESGRAQRSEFIPFDSDGAANGYARSVLASNSIVEVWSIDRLLTRLDRDDPARPKPTAKCIASWENEGGSSLVRR